MQSVALIYLLMVLSQNGAGDIHAAFVNNASLSECEASKAAVEGIFRSQNIPLLYSQCNPSELQFTEYRHTPTTSASRYFYLVSINNETEIEVTPAEQWQACVSGQRELQAAGNRVYCASSTQRLLEAGSSTGGN